MKLDTVDHHFDGVSYWVNDDMMASQLKIIYLKLAIRGEGKRFSA